MLRLAGIWENNNKVRLTGPNQTYIQSEILDVNFVLITNKKNECENWIVNIVTNNRG